MLYLRAGSSLPPTQTNSRREYIAAADRTVNDPKKLEVGLGNYPSALIYLSLVGSIESQWFLLELRAELSLVAE